MGSTRRLWCRSKIFAYDLDKHPEPLFNGIFSAFEERAGELAGLVGRERLNPWLSTR